MVRQGPVVTLAAVVVLLALTGRAAGQADGVEKAEPLDRQPYKIQAHVAIDPESRIDGRKRAALLYDWLALADRFVGPPWELEVAPPDSPLANLPLDVLDAGVFHGRAGGWDKIWVIQIGRAGAGYRLSGREFDAATGRVGPIQRRPAPFAGDAPRALFQLARDLFSPSAVIGERFGKDVKLTVRGASLEAASPIGRVVAVGTVFQPLRLVPLKNKTTRVQDIPFSYLKVEALEGPVARCSVLSIYSNPLTNQMVQETALAALGVKTGKAPTRLRFVTKPDKAPAAGYTLTARASADGLSREVGMTDREGRIVIPSGWADGLLILRLLAGNIEPMVEFPALLGQFAGERTIPIDPRPMTVTLETQLDSLRDEVLDLVAVRARLESRLKARFDGEDWPGVEATLKEFNQLPSRETYSSQVARLKEDAVQQQAKSKTAILTKTAQAQLAEVQSLVERYLDDEGFKSYAEGLERVKIDAAKPKKKEAPKVPAPPPPAPAKPAPPGKAF